MFNMKPHLGGYQFSTVMARRFPYRVTREFEFPIVHVMYALRSRIATRAEAPITNNTHRTPVYFKLCVNISSW